MLNEKEIEPNAYKVYVVFFKKGYHEISSIILHGVFDDEVHAIHYCNYYLDNVNFYIVDPQGNVIYC